MKLTFHKALIYGNDDDYGYDDDDDDVVFYAKVCNFIVLRFFIQYKPIWSEKNTIILINKFFHTQIHISGPPLKSRDQVSLFMHFHT